ncbi:helix-turn-helix domain-containing protein [Streptomyces sp. NPDC048566]|uniref:helix-turn-helix domain-containing protein n=1 Tax=Streptomyces sp. NPDC048566 TaxID=3365569 RepID=UPI00371DE6BF
MELLGQPDFGRLLRRLRVERGLSQADLVGPKVSASYVSRLESGSRAVTSQAAGHLAERLGIAPDVFRIASGAASGDRAPALLASAVAALEDGEPAEAVRQLTTAAALPDVPAGQRWQVLWFLARAHELLGDVRVRREVLDRLDAVARESGIVPLRARVLTGLSDCHLLLGETDAAVGRGREALASAEDAGATDADRLEALLAVTAAELAAGRLGEAEEHAGRLLERSGQASRSTGRRRVRALWTAAAVYTARDAHQRALHLLTEAVGAADARDDLLLWARVRLAAVAAHIEVHGGMTADPERWCREAEAALGMMDDGAGHVGELWAVQARVALQQGEPAVAAGWCRKALAAPGVMSRRDRVRTEILLREAELATGAGEPAAAELRRIAEETTRSGSLDLATRAWKALAQAALPGT